MSNESTDTTDETTNPITESPMYGQRYELISLTRNLFRLLHPEPKGGDTGTARQYAVVWGIKDALAPTEDHIEAAREYEAARAARAAESGRNVLTGDKLETKIQRVADWAALHGEVADILDGQALAGPMDNVGNPIILADGPSVSKADRMSRKIVKDHLKAHIRFRKRGMQTWGDVPNALKARLLFEACGLDPDSFDYSDCGEVAAPVQTGFVPAQTSGREAVNMVVDNAGNPVTPELGEWLANPKAPTGPPTNEFEAKVAVYERLFVAGRIDEATFLARVDSLMGLAESI